MSEGARPILSRRVNMIVDTNIFEKFILRINRCHTAHGRVHLHCCPRAVCSTRCSSRICLSRFSFCRPFFAPLALVVNSSCVGPRLRVCDGTHLALPMHSLDVVVERPAASMLLVGQPLLFHPQPHDSPLMKISGTFLRHEATSRRAALFCLRVVLRSFFRAGTGKSVDETCD